MAGYNRTRYVEELLERTESSQPSFTVHLHPEYWTLNNGSKFLYNNQIASLLDDIRAHRIPVDFLELLEAAKVPFYDGCMIVELLDYRPQRTKEPALEKPERTRAVLHPNSETLWADVCSLNQRYGAKWTDQDALEIEARLLLATAPPLCLDPDPHLARIANHVLRVSTPTIPVSLKRKAVAMDPEEDETDKVRRAKVMQFMSPRSNRTHAPSYRILDALQNSRQSQTAKSQTPQLPTHQFISNSRQPSALPATPLQAMSQAHSPTDSEDKKKTKTKKQSDTPQMQYTTPAFTRANGSQTPVPSQMTHQFINHQNPSNSSPTPSAQSPVQPQVYPNVQAATEAANTPVQQKHYSQSPRPPSQPLPSSQLPAHPQNPQPHPASLPTFQPTTPSQHFLHQPPAGARNVVSKAPTTNAPQQPPQQPPNAHTLVQAQLIYAQQLQQGQQVQQQQALILQQRLNQAQKNGRSTPSSQAASSPARGSPMVANQPLAARSPMPQNSQPPPQQMPHSAQHPQHLTFAPQYNPGHLRPMVHTTPAQHPQSMASSHQVNHNPGTQTASDGQPQMQQVHPPPHPYSQMYGYPTLNFTMQAGRMPPGYWPIGMGRGIPGIVNGQPIPGIVTNAQQMPLGVGKTGPAGLQGR